jgi:type IV pilus assembly protein PilY1
VRSGSYVVTWNDTQFGGDYDMDLVGFLRWELHQLADGSYRLDVLTDVLGHDAGAKGSHGYSIVGIDEANDKRYLTHGSNDMQKAEDTDCHAFASDSLDYVLRCRFANAGMATQADTANPARDGFKWPSKASGKVNGVVQNRDVDFIEVADADTTGKTVSTTTRNSFSLPADASATTPTTLRDPLWYMAKYGSFDTGETKFALASSKTPQSPQLEDANPNWDQVNNSGAACAGSSCADGEPDGYFLGRRPELLEERLRNLFNGLRNEANSAVAVSTAQLLTNSLKYVASFEDKGNVRGGTIEAFAVDANGDFSTTSTWSAGDKLLSTRSIDRVVISNGQSGASVNSQVGVALTSTALNGLYTPTGSTVSTYMEKLGGGTGAAEQTLAANLISYLRGEKDGLDGQLFMDRGDKSAMGSVVNSSPWLQDPSSTAKYSDGDFASDTSYAAYVRSHLQNNKVLWVGANDGLLHGFDALTGKPVLSYLPSPLVSSLADALTVNRKDAVPLMDGSPFTGDVLVSSSTASAWHTYLFSSLGRGGKAVFALDVSDTGRTSSTGTPSGGFAEANAGNMFKWMFTAADNANLGHVLSEPVVHFGSGQASPIVRLNNGRFAMMVPNGVGSSTGQGTLFLLFVEGPSSDGWHDNVDYKALTDGVITTGNGYTGATWVDLNNDGTADVLYATDLQGHVWKFDVRSSDPQDWGSAFKDEGDVAVPFFTAQSSTGQALPITTSPVTSFPDFGGVMVSFGTGKAIDNGDFPNWSDVQRFFSVWDQGHFKGDQVAPPVQVQDASGQPVAAHDVPTVSNLQEVFLARDDRGIVYRYTLSKDGSGTKVPVPTSDVSAVFNPADGSKWGGWFFNFPLADNAASSGEQLIFSPVARRTYIAFSSVRPLTNTDASCSEAPQGTFYAFNPSTGRAVKGLLPTATPSEGTSSAAYGSGTESQRSRDIQDRTGSGKDIGSACTAGQPNCKCDAAGKCRIVGPCGCEKGQVAVQLLKAAKDGKTCGCVPLSNLRLQWRDLSGMKTK